MSVLVLLFLAIGALAADRGDELAVSTNSQLVGSGNSGESGCQRDGPSCLDCKTVGYCRAGALTRVSCRGLYPYCDQTTGTCTGERNRCKIPESKTMIECPVQGYFPDPDTCRGFYVCEGAPLKSYKFQCSTLQVYDPEEKKCTRPGLRTRCLGFSCLGKQGRYTPYSGDESIYAMCRDGRASDPLKCPEGEIFEEGRQKCQKKCTSEKNLPDLDDTSCKRYIRCTKSGNRYVSSPGTCLGQRLFNPESGKCVESGEYTCKNSHTESPVTNAGSPVTPGSSHVTAATSPSTPISSTANAATSSSTSRIGLASRPFDAALLRDAQPVHNHDQLNEFKHKDAEKPLLKPTESSVQTSSPKLDIHVPSSSTPILESPEKANGKIELKTEVNTNQGGQNLNFKPQPEKPQEIQKRS